MNVIFRGKTKEILESMVKEGYANTQSEAVRLAVIDFGEHYLDEEELVKKGIEIEMQEIRKGKTKTKSLAGIKKKYGL